MIEKNSAYCWNCEMEIESESAHDFVSCLCGDIFVDGGKDYLRHGWKYEDAYENTSIVTED